MNSEKLLVYACCGSYESDNSPYSVTESLEAQKILLFINKKARSLNEISSHIDLSEEDIKAVIDPIVNLNLIIAFNENDIVKYKPNFPIITSTDYALLKKELFLLSNKLYQSVIDIMPQIKSKIQSLPFIKNNFSVPDIDYIVIGGCAFDYAGLDFLKKEELMTVTKQMPGGQYLFSAYTPDIADLNTHWMWGHNGDFGKYTFSSHGQLPSNKARQSFPDQAWRWNYLVGKGESKSVTEQMILYGKILESVLEGINTISDIADHLEITKFDVVYALNILVNFEYIGLKVENQMPICYLKRPVFTSKDMEVIADISSSIFEHFKATNMKKIYTDMKKKYEATQLYKNGIPFVETFNLLYHSLFENASDKLMREEYITKPLLRKDGAHYAPWVIIHEEKSD